MEIHFKSALVTGGAGFIGSHIVDALLAAGCEVTVLDNLSTGHLSNLEHVRDRITFHRGDIRNQDILMKAAEGCDVIFHQAAIVSIPQTVENPVESAMVNDMGTLFVLEAAHQCHVKRVVFASSCAIYGDDPELPKHEGMPPKPLTPYSVQKLTGEFYARLFHDLYQVETVCLRYFNVYGPRQDPSSAYSGVISIFMTKAAAKERPLIFGDGEQYRDFVFVKDVVQANLRAASAAGAIGKRINVGTGKFVRINELWEMVSYMAELEIEPEYGPARTGDIPESVANISLAKSLLGFEQKYSFEKGLRATFEWYNEGVKC